MMACPTTPPDHPQRMGMTHQSHSNWKALRGGTSTVTYQSG